MQDYPYISVVIRNRNESKHLEYVLKSLEIQNYSDFEIILVDNNSTDNSVKIAEHFGAKALNIKNFTYGKALNFGIDNAKGEIIVILSAHSIPLGSNFLRECAKGLEDKNTGAARLVYSGKGGV